MPGINSPGRAESEGRAGRGSELGMAATLDTRATDSHENRGTRKEARTIATTMLIFLRRVRLMTRIRNTVHNPTASVWMSTWLRWSRRSNAFTTLFAPLLE